MNETAVSLIQGLCYILLIIVATRHSWKKGEKEGSVFMLQYLRENKFMNDTDYASFMRHVREEKGLSKIKNIDPKDLKKKNDKDIHDRD